MLAIRRVYLVIADDGVRLEPWLAWHHCRGCTLRGRGSPGRLVRATVWPGGVDGGVLSVRETLRGA